MRPDEEYEDAEDAPAGVNSRAMSWMVLAVAVGGFAALAYYAYHSGAQPAGGNDAMVIEADGTPIKTAPDAPDGEQFANKDKTIYDAIASDGGAKTVEKLMPEAERPVAAANVEDSEDNMPVAAPSQAAVSAVAQQPIAPAASATVTATPVPSTTTYVAESPVAEKSFEAPQMINEKKATAPKEEAKPEPAKVVKAEAKPKAEKPAATTSTGGAYKIQLGAFKSEAEAKTSWNKISSKFSLSSAPVIVKADVNGGTFYRLRTGSYASSADAKAACAKLAGQACMPVK